MSSIGFLFPGQGSQYPGMGRELADAYPEARAVFNSADAALGESLSATCFEGSEESLALTENTQPAILTVSVAALRALQSRGVPAPSAAAGHSLGEYSAHVAAGSIAFEDAVRTVRLRGRFMQEAVPVGEGAMAAILGLEPEAVAEVCREAAEEQVVSAANLNGPGQVVIAGHRDAVHRAVDAAKAAGARKAIPLSVSAPFHSALMEPAATRLDAVLREVRFRESDCPVFTNVDAVAQPTPEASRDALVRQVAAPVRWQELVEAMLANGIETFVELGPGRVLSGLVRRIHRKARVLNVDKADDVDRVAAALKDA